MAGPLNLNYDPNHLPMIHTIVSLDQLHPIRFIETAAADTLFIIGDELICLWVWQNIKLADHKVGLE